MHWLRGFFAFNITEKQQSQQHGKTISATRQDYNHQRVPSQHLGWSHPRHSSDGDVQDTYVLKSYNINVYIATFFPAAFDEISNFTLPFFDFTCQLVTNSLPVLYNNCSLCVWTVQTEYSEVHLPDNLRTLSTLHSSNSLSISKVSKLSHPHFVEISVQKINIRRLITQFTIICYQLTAQMMGRRMLFSLNTYLRILILKASCVKWKFDLRYVE